MRLLDPNHPMFQRPWVRWATVLLPGLWAVMEFALGNPGWGLLFGAAAAYAAWELFFRRQP